jgi:hypothetical protein
MCINQKDVQAYNLIMKKMSKHEQLSEQDKEFMVEHDLKQKYDAYNLLLDLKQRLYGSNVSSLKKS